METGDLAGGFRQLVHFPQFRLWVSRSDQLALGSVGVSGGQGASCAGGLSWLGRRGWWRRGGSGRAGGSLLSRMITTSTTTTRLAGTSTRGAGCTGAGS